MAYGYRIAAAVGALRQRFALADELRDGVVELQQQEIAPAIAARRLDGVRLFRDQPPPGGLELRRTPDFELVTERGGCEAAPQGIVGIAAEGAYQAITHRVRRRLGFPLAHQLAEFATLGRRLHGLLVDQCQQQVAPARQEQRAGIELNGQHVRLGRRMRESQQVIADLARPCADVVTPGSHVDLIVAEYRLERSIHHALICGPEPADRRIGNARMIHRVAEFERAEQAIRPRAARHTA